MALLQVKDVSKQYEKDKKVFSDINMEICEGEFVSIIGPSGAGKSTFLRCINRMIDISEGDIHFDDVTLWHYPKKSCVNIERKSV